MPGAFSGISMTANALRFFQRAMETTGHNIANVNTEGYSRQTVEFKTSIPLTIYSQGFKAMGTGVSVSAIKRIRDGYLEANARSNTSDLSKFQMLSAALKQIEGAYREPGDEGIAAAMDKFFDAWSALGSNPTDTAARVQVQNAGSILAGRIRSTHNQMRSLENQLNSSTNSVIDRINELGREISTLNSEIREFSATAGSPNDLLDLRDKAVRELSGLINTQVETFEDGSYAVYAAGFPLVDSTGSREIDKNYDASSGTFTSLGITFNVRSGELAGLLQATSTLGSEKAQLDLLANELRTQFNTLHQTGIDADGNTGNDFFNDSSPQSGAIDFDLSAVIKASPRAIAAGTSGTPGDGGLALSMAQMRDNAIVALGNKTFHDYHQTNVGQIGSQAAYYKSAEETENAIALQIQSQVEAVSGVSIDDEMAEMMRYQRSYQAAARALTVFDQITEDLIGMLRR